MSTEHDWTAAARRELADLGLPDGSWGYRKGAAGCVEPTVLAALALGPVRAEGRDTAEFLASLQARDGSLGVSRGQPVPGWMTPYAMLYWDATGSFAKRTQRAAAWLLGVKGQIIPRSDDPGRVVGHDTTLVGWPWVADTHSWLEPTVLAVLALGRAGFGEHARVSEGLTLIRDRAVKGGGWNYGNKAVFGRALRPQPGPTGLALLALAGTPDSQAVVGPAVAYLERTLPAVRAPSSLAWGLIGLNASGRAPADSPAWLAESYANFRGRDDSAVKLAMLLLAARPDAPRLFGRDAAAPALVTSAGGGPDALESLDEGSEP